MTPLLVIRHASAAARHKWEDADLLRPLDDKGRRQAQRLVDRLRLFEVRRVLSSPSLRCTQTVAPLAAAAGVAVEERDELAEGMARAALELVRDVAGQSVALCTHGDVIPRILEALVIEDGVALGDDPQWQKASTWVLHGTERRFVKVDYIEPPRS